MLTKPFRYPGGKHYLAERIVNLMPPPEQYTRYVEAYAGGASTLLARPVTDCAEWINDTNLEVTNFWRVIRSKTKFREFVRYVGLTPVSQVEFQDAKRAAPIIDTIDGDVWPAVQFFIRARQSRQGLRKDYCTPTSRLRRGMNENVSAWLSAVDGLQDVHERLCSVEVWDRPALDVIDALDSPETFFYLDPPYHHDTRVTKKEYGSQQMSPEDHAELLGKLFSIQGKFMLSGYDCEMYQQAAIHGRWRVEQITIPNNASSKRKKETKVECLWMNY